MTTRPDIEAMEKRLAKVINRSWPYTDMEQLIAEVKRARRSDDFHTEACGAHQSHIDELQARIAELERERERDELRAGHDQCDKAAQIILGADIGYPNRSTGLAGAVEDIVGELKELRADAERLQAIVDESCWSCGKPMRHDDECLCRGCGHHVCVKCADEQGHNNFDNKHGRYIDSDGQGDDLTERLEDHP